MCPERENIVSSKLELQQVQLRHWQDTYKFLMKVNSSKALPLEVQQRFLNTLQTKLSEMDRTNETNQTSVVNLEVKQTIPEINIYISTSNNLGSRYLEQAAKECLVNSAGRKLHSDLHDYYVEIRVIPELRASC